MNRHLATIAFLLLIVGTFGVVARVHAQLLDGPGSSAVTPASTVPGSNQDFTPGNGSLLMDGGSGTSATCSTPPCADAANAAPSQDSGGGNANPAGTKTPTPFIPSSGGTDSSTYGPVMTWIMSLFAWLLGVAMITLDNAVYYTVVTMGNYLHNISAVGVAWRILRDVGNIVLIFGFLAIGISTIIGYDFYGSRTKMLPTLLIAAVFINFSLFASEAIVDVGNLFATEFYAQINGGTLPTAPENFDLSAVQNEGISNKIMSQLGLQNIYKPSGTIFTKDTPWYIGFMGILLFLTASFVIFSLAFILIARFVMLIFLIIVAPVGFAGLAVPKLEATAKKWWSKLFEQTITAPILLLLLYVALAVITDANFMTGFGVSGSSGASNVWTGWTGSSGDLTGFAGVMISFLVAMGLLGAVVMVSKSISAAGGEWATKWGTRLSGASLVAAGYGALHRNTYGAAGYHSAKYIRKSRLGRTVLGRGIANNLEKMGKASFDARNSDLAKQANKTFGLNLGKGPKGGYAKEYEGAIKAYQKGAEDSITDRKKTAEEDAAIKSADAARDAAAAALRNASTAKLSAEQAHAPNVAKRQRLEAEKAKDRFWEANPENVRKLQEAQQKESASEQALTAANAGLTDARKRATETANKAKEVSGVVISNIKADTKQRKENYADRLQALGKFQGWVTVGLGGRTKREAAANIRKNAGKSKDEQETEKLLKSLKKAADKAEKETETDAAKEEKSEPKAE